jgi:hypothetical protein
MKDESEGNVRCRRANSGPNKSLAGGTGRQRDASRRRTMRFTRDNLRSGVDRTAKPAMTKSRPRPRCKRRGADHPDTLNSRNNLAYAYQAARLGQSAIVGLLDTAR